MPDSIKDLIIQSTPFIAMAPTGGVKLNTQRVMEMVIAASILSYVAYQGLLRIEDKMDVFAKAQNEMRVDIGRMDAIIGGIKEDVDILKRGE
jgi:hypothetical protein